MGTHRGITIPDVTPSSALDVQPAPRLINDAVIVSPRRSDEQFDIPRRANRPAHFFGQHPAEVERNPGRTSDEQGAPGADDAPDHGVGSISSRGDGSTSPGRLLANAAEAAIIPRIGGTASPIHLPRRERVGGSFPVMNG